MDGYCNLQKKKLEGINMNVEREKELSCTIVFMGTIVFSMSIALFLCVINICIPLVIGLSIVLHLKDRNYIWQNLNV